MGKLGIFDEDQFRWVQFDEDTEIRLKYINKEELTKINSKAEKAARLTGTDEREVFNRLLAERAVHGWRHVDNHDHSGLIVRGEQLPFNDTNRNMLMKKSIEFSSFVNGNCTNSRLFLDDDQPEPAEGEGKNG